MIIRNRKALATTRMRERALDIIEAGINRVLPPNIMRFAVRYDAAGRVLTVSGDTYPVKGRTFVVGGGKAAGRMAEALEGIIPPGHISAGVVTCKGGGFEKKEIKVVQAGHPIPDERGVNGAVEMLALKQCYSIDERDLVICLLSGGGSSLMTYPVDEVSLADVQRTTELLLGSGAEIAEINAVRKHLSKTQGGRLGQFFAPATVISLIISDVVGNDLSVIASGPTYPDPSTFSDAYSVLKKYDLLDKVPKSVANFLKRGCQGEVEETPKALDNCHNYIIGDNRMVLEAMSGKAEEFSFSPCIITLEQKGDTAEVARSRAEEILASKYPGCGAILIGGETTPRLPASAGRGGRNQHYAAVSLLAMAGYHGEWVAASVGTDGSDYLPDVAGAIVDNHSLDAARAKGVDIKEYINSYDSYTLLDRIDGCLIMTGETGTNVGDIILYLLK